MVLGNASTLFGVRTALLVMMTSLVVNFGHAQTLIDPNLTVSTYASGLTRPGGFAFIGPDNLFVTELYVGRVVRVQDGVVTSTVLELNVIGERERGLLGIAVHPQFESNDFVYLYYSVKEEVTEEWVENRLSRFT